MAIIDEIKAAELKAAKIKEDAKASARSDSEIIEVEANRKAKAMKDEALSEMRKLLQKAETESETSYAQAAGQTKADCEKLIEKGSENIDAAADMIFEKALII